MCIQIHNSSTTFLYIFLNDTSHKYTNILYKTCSHHVSDKSRMEDLLCYQGVVKTSASVNQQYLGCVLFSIPPCNYSISSQILIFITRVEYINSLFQKLSDFRDHDTVQLKYVYQHYDKNSWYYYICYFFTLERLWQRFQPDLMGKHFNDLYLHIYLENYHKVYSNERWKRYVTSKAMIGFQLKYIKMSN